MAYADHVVKIITIKSVIHYCFSAVKRKHNMHVGIFDKCLYIEQCIPWPPYEYDWNI